MLVPTSMQMFHEWCRRMLPDDFLLRKVSFEFIWEVLHCGYRIGSDVICIQCAKYQSGSLILFAYIPHPGNLQLYTYFWMFGNNSTIATNHLDITLTQQVPCRWGPGGVWKSSTWASWTVAAGSSGCLSRNQKGCEGRKGDKEPKNHQIWKGKIIWTKPPWLWFHVNFPGCRFFLVRMERLERRWIEWDTKHWT